jgi:sugar lactone lactonase YvrE
MAIFGLGIALSLGSILAQTTTATMTASDGMVVIKGLNGPQGVLVTADGSVWAIDSGMGGKTAVFKTFNPESGQVENASYGLSARLMRLQPDGTLVEVAKTPSAGLSTGALGGSRFAFLVYPPSGSFASRVDQRSLGGRIYFTSGEWDIVADQTSEKRLRGLAAVMALDNGLAVEVANTFDLEKQNNFDQTTDIHSHPYGITAGSDGMLYIADAGANALLKLNPFTRQLSHVVTFEPMPGVFPSPTRNGAMLADPVPTAIVANPDGTLLVSLLSGAPFIPGSSKVVMVKGQTVSDYAGGLTMTTDLKRGPDGQLYATQFGLVTEKGFVPNAGAVVRVVPGGAPQPIVSGLSFPTSLDFDFAGNMFVAINGVGAPGSGQVLKFTGVAKAK